jgi:hypothetical protein
MVMSETRRMAEGVKRTEHAFQFGHLIAFGGFIFFSLPLNQVSHNSHPTTSLIEVYARHVRYPDNPSPQLKP